MFLKISMDFCFRKKKQAKPLSPFHELHKELTIVSDLQTRMSTCSQHLPLGSVKTLISMQNTQIDIFC